MTEDIFKSLEEIAKSGTSDHDNGADAGAGDSKGFDKELVVSQKEGGKAMYGNGAKPSKKKKKKKKKAMSGAQKKEESYGNGGQPEQKEQDGGHGPSDPKLKKKSLEIPSEYSLGGVTPEDRSVLDRIAKGQVREGAYGDEAFSATDNLLVNYANVMIKSASFIGDTLDETSIIEDMKARSENDPFLSKALTRLDIDGEYVKGVVATFGKSKAERDPEADLVRLKEILKG